MTALLEAHGLSLPQRLLGVSLQVAPGELVCVVGPNGSGKTSLLHAIAGIGSPSGEVTIDGVDPRQAGPARRPGLLTYLPASRDVRWPMTARDVIALGGGTTIPEALELGALLDRRIDQLSTGERGRVLLARALAPRPKLLLLDEPTANLDPLWQIRLMEMLRDELQGSGRAALVAIHDLDAAGRYADRTLVMDRGRIAATGIEGPHIADIFGINRVNGEWRPVRPAADRQSSP
jgi:iron complex transport system ATP-binding protein